MDVADLEGCSRISVIEHPCCVDNMDRAMLVSSKLFQPFRPNRHVFFSIRHYSFSVLDPRDMYFFNPTQPIMGLGTELHAATDHSFLRFICLPNKIVKESMGKTNETAT